MSTSKRFEIVASTKELVLEVNKTAVRIELQYGKDGAPTEIVIGGEDTIGCSESGTDRQTVITDSLPYRDPSDS